MPTMRQRRASDVRELGRLDDRREVVRQLLAPALEALVDSVSDGARDLGAGERDRPPTRTRSS